MYSLLWLVIYNMDLTKWEKEKIVHLPIVLAIPLLHPE